MYFSGRPRKLADCRLRGAGTELFLVEGDSASSSVIAVRDASFQAVFPMQGKPLNPMKSAAAKVTTNPLYAALIATLGAGWGPGFALARLRYERVLILMDPDADGIHCGLLLQMFFYQWLRPLVESGRLLTVWAPMAEIQVAGQANPVPAYTEPHLQSVRDTLRRDGARILDTIHYRGLGGMNPAMLARTCVIPASRTVAPVEVPDVRRAIEVFGGVSVPMDSQMDLFGP